jgi:hypothetical protein
MAEFTAGEHTYRTVKLNVREQLQLLRVLSPLSGSIIEIMVNNDADNPAPPIMLMVPLLKGFHDMSEDDLDTLLNKCFASVQRREGGNGSAIWGPVLYNMAAKRFVYDDVAIGDLFIICWNVIQENLGGFFGIGSATASNNITSTQATGPMSPG